MELWMTTDNRTFWVLQEGHGILGRSLGRFGSINEMEDRAIDYLRKDIAKKRAVLQREEKILDDAVREQETHFHRSEV
jgi:hypothetical protein